VEKVRRKYDNLYMVWLFTRPFDWHFAWKKLLKHFELGSVDRKSGGCKSLGEDVRTLINSRNVNHSNQISEHLF